MHNLSFINALAIELPAGNIPGAVKYLIKESICQTYMEEVVRRSRWPWWTPLAAASLLAPSARGATRP